MSSSFNTFLVFQFRAVSYDHGVAPFCPYGKMSSTMGGNGNSDAEHACFGTAYPGNFVLLIQPMILD